MSLLKNLLISLIMPTKTLSNVMDFLAVLQHGKQKKAKEQAHCSTNTIHRCIKDS
jgi:hypothetical protein